MKPLTVNDFYTKYYVPANAADPSGGGGVLSWLGSIGSDNIPWDAITGSRMDMIYHTSHSGKKLASDFLVDRKNDGDLSNELRMYFAQILEVMFANDWLRLWNALQLDYNPIQNYNATEFYKDVRKGKDTLMTDSQERQVDDHGQQIDGADSQSGTNTRTLDLTDGHGGADTVTTKGDTTQDETVKPNQVMVTVKDKTLQNVVIEQVDVTKDENTVEKSVETINPQFQVVTTTEHVEPHTLTEVREYSPNPASPFTTTTRDSGKEVTTEKGGTQEYTWGIDSSTPVPSAMSLSTGGQGTVSGTGDGSSPGDGHVTTVEYVDREHSESVTGEKMTETEVYTLDGGAGKTTQRVDNPEYTIKVNENVKTPKLIESTKTEITNPETERQTTTTTDNPQIETNIKTHVDDTVTTTYNSSVKHSGTDALQHGLVVKVDRTIQNSGVTDTKKTGTDIKSVDETFTHDFTRSGNIGVTTTQQMLESEYELRKKHFFNQVFADIDSVLTIPIWN